MFFRYLPLSVHFRRNVTVERVDMHDLHSQDFDANGHLLDCCAVCDEIVEAPDARGLLLGIGVV